MATTRFNKRAIFANANDSLYHRQLKSQGTDRIVQYTSGNLTYPTVEQIQQLQIETHIWTTGDAFFKLAFKYYNDVDYWWIIPFFNKKPTEQHFQVGDVVYIPLPLYEILSIMSVG